MAYVIDRYPCQDSPRLGAMTLHPEPESVPRARRWFRKFIAPYNPACSVDDCALMISELVTNAVCYGKSDDPWLVRVEWFRDRTSLRVEVHSWCVGPSRLGGTVVTFVMADAWPTYNAERGRGRRRTGGR